MDFKNGKELLERCAQEGCSISQVMLRRECVLGETSADEVKRRMMRVLEIMRESAVSPLKTPQRSMGGLIGGEAKRLSAHSAKKARYLRPGASACHHLRNGRAGGQRLHGFDCRRTYGRFVRRCARLAACPARAIPHF